VRGEKSTHTRAGCCGGGLVLDAEARRLSDEGWFAGRLEVHGGGGGAERAADRTEELAYCMVQEPRQKAAGAGWFLTGGAEESAEIE
jgi:hypothetical protein